MYPASGFAIGFTSYVAPCTVLWDETNAQSDEDFFLEVAGVPHRIQLREIGMPGRQRGLEYRDGGRPGPFEDEDYEAGGRLGAVWIRQAIEDKIRKNYSTAEDLHLLLYVNFAAWDLKYQAIREEAGPALKSFASVWLVTGNMFCGLHEASRLGAPSAGWAQIPA